MHRRLYSSAVEMRRLKQAKIYRRSDKVGPSSRMVRKKRLASDAMDSEAILQKLTDSEWTSGSRSVCTEEDWRLAIPTRLRLKFEPGGSWRFVSLSVQNNRRNMLVFFQSDNTQIFLKQTLMTTLHHKSIITCTYFYGSIDSCSSCICARDKNRITARSFVGIITETSPYVYYIYI